MTLPFENDTRIIVKKLAKRNLKADKSRNILIIITIALATCLIMTTTLYFFASQRKSLMMRLGVIKQLSMKSIMIPLRN